MEVRPLDPFGAEIVGLDAARASGEEIAACGRLLGEGGVLVLRDQTLDDDGFATFLARFGALTFTRGETPVAHRPELNVVTNAGRTTPPRSTFHTDTSYVEEPPAITALRAVTIPARGGATDFANQYDAFDRLDAGVRARLAGRRVLHRVTGLPEDVGGTTETWHPLFRRHPVSGRTALFLSTPARCVSIEGLSHDEARETVAALFEHSVAGPLYRHAWRPGDVVMWDNRCMLHRADHSNVEGERTLHRGMVAGERPIAA